MTCLLFFDTFSHEVNSASKLDLVQFPKAVQVTEVRVIPLGARVQADFPGGVRLGATNPSQFVIDFFVNDLGKRGAATFENVGQLQYSEQGPIKLDFEKNPPTDGLLLRGAYNTITLAVYGNISKVNRDPQPTPPPPPAPASPVPLQPPAAGRELTQPTSASAAPAVTSKREASAVVATPSLPHPLPEKVNPNERIRNWLQDTQIPHSPLDLDSSPTKVWDDPPYDSDAAPGICKDGLSPQTHSREISLHRSPPHSPPHSPPATSHSQPPSPPHSPLPSPQQSRVPSREQSQRQSLEVAPQDPPTERSHGKSLEPSAEKTQERPHGRSHERSHDRSHEQQSHSRSHDRSHDRSHERSHERSRERSDHDSRAGKHSRHKSRQRSVERSRDHSEHRSVSLSRSHTAELWDKDPTEAGGERVDYPPPRETSGKEKKEKRSKESRKTREEKRGKRRSLEEWDDTDGGHSRRRRRSHSSDSTREGGPRTPPPPLLPPPARKEHRGGRGGDQDEVQENSSKRRRLDRKTHGEAAVGDGAEATTAAAAVGGGGGSGSPGGGGAMLFDGDMEAISDDEDLPDVPPSGDAAVVLQTDASVDDITATAASAGPADFDFEEIMSDEEELPEYQEFEEEGVEEEYIVEEWEDWLKPYALLQDFQCVPPLVYLTSPALTPYQARLARGGGTALEDESATKLSSLLEDGGPASLAAGDDEREVFVQSCEQLVLLLPNALLPLEHDKLTECVSVLCCWLEAGLDMEQAMAQAHPVYKIRHLKAGLRLCIALCQCSDDITRRLLSQLPLLHQLQHLYHQPHMALSIKLLILRCIDSILSTRAGVQEFLSVQPKLQQTGYEVTLQLLASTTHTRAKVSAAAILRKLHLLEVMEKLRDDVAALHATLPPPPQLQTMDIVEDAALGLEDQKSVRNGEVHFMASDASMHSDSALRAASASPLPDPCVPPDWCAEAGLDGEAVPDEDGSVAEDDEVDMMEAERDSSEEITVSRHLITSITSCLQHVLHTFKHAEHILAQPHRYLPVGKQFQVPRCTYDVMQEVLVLLDHGGLCASIATLCSALSVGLRVEPVDDQVATSPREPALSSLYALLLQLLQALVDCPRGLTYLAAHHFATTTLIRSLLKSTGGISSRLGRVYNYGAVPRDDQCDGVSEDACVDVQECGVQLLERLHVLHQLDSLALVCSTPPCDLQQSLVHLNTLAAMLLTHPSKLSLAKALAAGDHITLLYPFLRVLQPGDTPESAPLRVALFGYAVELLTVAVKLDGNASFMEAHAEKICQIIDAEKTKEGPPLDESAKLLELLPWLSLARKPESFSYDTIPQLVDVVKDQLGHVEKFPGELFAALRIMKSLAIPKHGSPSEHLSNDSSGSDDVIQELKYKYAIVQLFYADLTSHLNTLLSAVCALFPQPGLHVSQLSGSEGGCLVQLLQPSLALLYCLLQQVIVARGSAYHDLSSVQPLLNTYLLVSAIPAASPHGAAGQLLQRKVLHTLLLYTQPGHNQDTPCNANSLWTQMLSQILKFSESAPHAMVAGLCLLTELLPLPLPVLGRQLTAGEKERCLVVRKLWAANLAPISESLYRLLLHQAPASQPSLTHALRRVCVALADLAPQMAVLIMRPLLDLALQYQRADAVSVTTTTPAPTVNTSASNSMSRILYMLASLSSHQGCKAAMLHLFTTEAYSALLPGWCSGAMQVNEERALRQHHSPLVLLVHHLCRLHNNMQGRLDTGLWGVPCRELLSPMLDCLVTVLSCPGVEHRLLHPLFATLSDVITHDFGLYHLKCVLDKRKACLLPVLQRLATDLSLSQSCLEVPATLHAVLELCRGLLSSDAVPRFTVDGAAPTESGSRPSLLLRTMCVTPAELSVYVGWTRQVASLPCEETLAADGRGSLLEGLSTGEETKTKIIGDDKIQKIEETLCGVDDAVVSEAGTAAAAVEPVNTVETTTADAAEVADKTTPVRHPLRVLEEVIVNATCSEALIEQLYSDVTELVALLDVDDAPVVSCKVSEPVEVGRVGVGGGSVTQQYEERLVCCPSAPHHEPPSLWLQPPPTQYGSAAAPVLTPATDGAVTPDSGPDMVAVSLCQLLRDCAAADYDLDVAVQKALLGPQAASSPQKTSPLNNGLAKFKSVPLPLRPGGRGVRPYGFPSRGVNLRTDPFRCRPPNTSRPPSLHVDDFVALESTGHQPTGPTGYNRISFGRGKMLLDSMRGRGNRGMLGRGALGDGRGGPMPGRFMYRPPMYRADFGNRGMMMRGPRWHYRGSDGLLRGGLMVGGGQFRPQGGGPMGGPRFMRGRNMFNRGAPVYGDRGMRHMRAAFH